MIGFLTLMIKNNYHENDTVNWNYIVFIKKIGQTFWGGSKWNNGQLNLNLCQFEKLLIYGRLFI